MGVAAPASVVELECAELEVRVSPLRRFGIIVLVVDSPRFRYDFGQV